MLKMNNSWVHVESEKRGNQVSKGYFLTVSDKTTCGGEILTGTSNIKFYGRQAAIEGSTVTCGRYSGNYVIVGGVGSFLDKGAKLAGTLDSQSTCPCNASLICSIPDSYQK
ncbi:PAAR domain-containing protein [Xenorhabdus sp. XENO-1]|uniref:PAAR domain-containing protein n=1 Tax=Xenorhabdus bovienii TaxID=40576 RepID=UPI0020CA36FC|nr:PAAR domain-containing protein [Xenorhabdus bovienii]MCP9268017.1 PAAR domain-containing protein [Xenorhabdus bovienii subsp. africana]